MVPVTKDTGVWTGAGTGVRCPLLVGHRSSLLWREVGELCPQSVGTLTL